MELLIPADAEVHALAELSAVLPIHGFPSVTTAAKRLGTKIPAQNPKPDVFGRLIAAGGTGRDLVTDSPTLTLEGYSVKEQQARDLCALMLAIIEAAVRAGSLGGATVYRYRTIALPQNLPNPLVPDHFRFTALISVDLRRVAV
ncbi:hypothetical protein E0W80_04485 [Microbacterium sp. PI-1]|uniref:hypothetical protein n=1 Tax=Microbacterium sp. PI-1 TaxID=2545631 RepID=UPI00103DE4F4|nr:hypothetical protein [Microbacterium sp. PI-1]TCJ28762.1 hypothetical protein E0W80_04485 [Microbacterium sp. PI-1]